MFRLSSLDHHQVVSLPRGNYTIYGMIQYVKLNYYDFNIYIFYHSIYCIVSSIQTYELMMDWWRAETCSQF